MTTENLKKHLIFALLNFFYFNFWLFIASQKKAGVNYEVTNFNLIPFRKNTKAPTTFPAFSAKIATLDSIQERRIVFGGARPEIQLLA